MKGQIENRIHAESCIWIRLKKCCVSATLRTFSFCALFFIPEVRWGGGAEVRKHTSVNIGEIWCLPYSRTSSWKQDGKDWQNDKVKTTYYFAPFSSINLNHLQEVINVVKSRHTSNKVCRRKPLRAASFRKSRYAAFPNVAFSLNTVADKASWKWKVIRT